MGACFGKYWSETQELSGQIVPLILIYLLEYSMVVTDFMMLGRLGRGHLSSFAVATGFFNIMWYFIEGFMTAQDTLSANAFEKRDQYALRYWLYSSLFAVFILCSMASVLFCFNDLVLKEGFFISSTHLRAKATSYILILMPSIWFLATFRALQKYLACQNITKPAIKGLLLGSGTNLVLNYLFIFLFGGGFSGCASATTISRLVMLLYMYAQVRKRSDFRTISKEVHAIAKGTPAELVLRGAAHVERAVINLPVEQGLATSKTLVVRGLDHVGKELHIEGLRHLADRISAAGHSSLLTDEDNHDSEDEDDEDDERPFMRGQEGEGGTWSSWLGITGADPRSSASIVPFMDPEEGDEEGRGGVEMSPVHSLAATTTIEKKGDQNSADGASDEDEEEDGGGTYLDDVNMGDSDYERKHVKNVRVVKNPRSRSMVKDTRECREEESGRDGVSENSDANLEIGEEEGEEELPSMSSMQGESTRPLSLGDDADTDADTDADPKPRRMLCVRTIRFFALGVPAGLMAGLENWIFVALIMFIARMGTIPTAASQLAIVLIQGAQLLGPAALSEAARIRIAHFLSTNQPDKANLVAKVSLAWGTVMCLLWAGLIQLIPKSLGLLFTGNEEVSHRFFLLAQNGTVAGVVLSCGLVCLILGPMRAQGKQGEVGGFAIATVWTVGLSLSYFWGFWVRPTFGLAGFWLGQLVGT